MLCQLIHNVNSKKGQRALLEDYLPFRKKPTFKSKLDEALYRAFRQLGA